MLETLSIAWVTLPAVAIFASGWQALRQAKLLRTSTVTVIPSSKLVRRVLGLVTGLGLMLAISAAVLLVLAVLSPAWLPPIEPGDVAVLALLVSFFSVTSTVLAIMYRGDTLAIGLSSCGVASGGWLIPWDLIEDVHLGPSDLVYFQPAGGGFKALMVSRVRVSPLTHEMSALEVASMARRLRLESGCFNASEACSIDVG